MRKTTVRRTAVAERSTLDVELDAIAGSLTAFTAKDGFHEVTDASDEGRRAIAEYLGAPMGDEQEARRTGGSN